MDTKKLLQTMIFTGLAMLALYMFFPGFFGKKTTPEAVATTSPYIATSRQSQLAEQGSTEKTITLGSAAKGSKDKLAVTINNVTAGIDRVQLNINDYAETIAKTEPLTVIQALPDMPKPFATLGIQVECDGHKIIDEAQEKLFLYTHHYIWKVVSETPTSVDLLATFTQNGQTVAEVTKSFTIDPSSYEVIIAHSVKNLSDKPIKVTINELGPTDLPRDNPQTDNRYYHAASFETAPKTIKGDKFHIGHAEFQKLATGTRELDKFTGTNHLVWAAAANRFFAAIVRPLPRENPAFETLDDGVTKIPVVDYLAQADIDVLELNADPMKTVTAMRLSGNRIEIPAGAATRMPLSVFFGPKQRSLLQGNPLAPADSEPYTFSAYKYLEIIQFSQGGPCAYCTFSWLGWFLLSIFDFLYKYVTFHNYGLAIMLLVIVVRAALHPLTRASQINMAQMSKKMATLKPQLDALKKKYPKDMARQNQEQLKIFKENNYNPAGGILGCLPMLIQMPIWIALYASLQIDIDLRHAAFIPGWISDLSSPDAVYTFVTPIRLWIVGYTDPVDGLNHVAINLLPLLLGIVFYFQMKITTSSQPKPADEQQAQMQKISSYMILIFPIFLYAAPSGLNLYIFASTLGGLVDTYLVRRTLRARGILPASAGALTNNPT